jgi:hypothetical protein
MGQDVGLTSHFNAGVGALASPLVATQFAQMHRWSFHYLVSLGIAATNTIALIAVFGLKSQDGDTLSAYIMSEFVDRICYPLKNA